MPVLKNRAKMSTSTTGTGTITLGSAEDGYQTFADAGVANADVVRYIIEDGSNFEIGTGTYTSSGTTLSRTVSESSNSDAAINLSGSATVFIGATAKDIPALYAENYDDTSTLPSATGTNAVAIGLGSVSSGLRSVAIGNLANASSLRGFAVGVNSAASGSNAISMGANSASSGSASVAIGAESSAASDNSFSLGYQAKTVTGSQATAVGYRAYASGTDSFAAAIGNNTGSYGATGANSIAIGREAKAAASDSLALGWASQTSGNGRATAIGYLTHASDFGATALGYDSDCSGDYSVAIGRSTNVAGENSVGIGYQAGTSVNNQVVLGGTTQQVKISNTYTLPTSDGTNGQVLTTNGSGAVTFADAGGGAALYVANESSPANQPTAAGANAIGIGDTAQAAGADGVAIGLQSYARAQSALGLFGDAQNVESVSIGKNSAATADGAVQLGRNGYSTATDAVSLGKSRAGAASSIAGSINQNSTSYGTTGVNTVAFGTQARATNNSAVSIGQSSIGSGYQSSAYGYNAVASGQDSFAGGSSTDATATRSTALGNGAQATHSNATAVGYNAATSATNQVSLGASGYAVRVSGNYTLPTADGTNGQVMTTDGSGAVTFADAGGGGVSAQTIDIKTADYTVVSADLGKIIKYFGAGADRTVTLTAGATLGEGFHVTILNANSGADERVVIDANSTERFGWANGPQTITLSRGELVRIIWDNTGGRWIIGEGGFNLAMRSDINPSSSTAVGDGVNSGIALGYNAQSAGSQAVALGRAYASGTDSFAAAIADNTSSYGATSTNSIAMGLRAKASGQHSIALGYQPEATGYYDVAIGDFASATGGFVTGGSIAIGSSAGATKVGSVAIGRRAYSNIEGKLAFTNNTFNNTRDGSAQYGLIVLKQRTTDATASTMTSDNNGDTADSPSTTNQVILPNNSAYSFSGTIIARESAAAGSDYASWEIKGALLRDANAASTVLGNGIQNKLYATSGASAWAIALTADTTNGGLKIEVTGAASTNIRWVATVNTSEVTYA